MRLFIKNFISKDLIDASTPSFDYKNSLGSNKTLAMFFNFAIAGPLNILVDIIQYTKKNLNKSFK